MAVTRWRVTVREAAAGEASRDQQLVDEREWADAVTPTTLVEDAGWSAGGE